MNKAILHSYWQSSCSWRVRIALNFKEIPYEIKPINLLKSNGEQFSEEFLKVNPMAKVPALQIDNQTLIESMSILEYLEETRPQNPLIPKNPVQKARVREICAVIVSGIQPLQNFGLRNYVGKENWVKWAQLWINKGFTGLEHLLASSGKKYSVGDDITLADCCLVPQIYNAKRYCVDMSLYPIISEIIKNLEHHPAILDTHPTKQPDCPDIL